MTETMYPSPESGASPSSMQSSQSGGNSSAGVANVREYAQNLMGLKSSATDRASSERDKAVQQIRSFVDDLKSMESNSSSGVASAVVGQTADKADSLASYLESKSPQEILGDVRSYASSHPGIFLAGAALAGGILGRASRAAASGAQQMGTDDSASYGSYEGAYASEPSVNDPMLVVPEAEITATSGSATYGGTTYESSGR